jgi:soluble lytic murein transglycosylase-like protein
MRLSRLAVSENVAPRFQPGIFDSAHLHNFFRQSLVSTGLLILFLAMFSPQSARAEYVVLKSGQRLVVTGYQLVGDTYKFQLSAGSAELPASEVVSIEPEEIFHSAPKPALADIPFANFISSAAQIHGVDPDLIVSVITAESKFNPKAISRKNARGLMQLLPETAARLGVKNSFDPRENIEGGTKYLRELLDRYDNNLALTLAAYNAGPQRIDQFKSIPPFRETISYVRRVQKTYNSRKASQHTSTQAKSNASPETKTGG